MLGECPPQTFPSSSNPAPASPPSAKLPVSGRAPSL